MARETEPGREAATRQAAAPPTDGPAHTGGAASSRRTRGSEQTGPRALPLRPDTPTQPLWAAPRRSLWSIPVALLLCAVAFVLRVAIPGADPPRWLTSDVAVVTDGPIALAEATNRLGAGHAEPRKIWGGSRGRTLTTWVASAVAWARGGLRPREASFYAALCGSLLVLLVFAGLLPVFGHRIALAAAAALAVDAALIGWARTPHPVTLGALGGAAAFGIAVAGRGRLVAVALAIVAAAAVAHGTLLAAGVAVVPIAALGLQVLARYRTERGRIALWIVLGLFIVAAAAVLVGSPALLRRSWPPLRHALSTAAPIELLHRALHAPARTRLGLLAPIVIGLGCVAPALARRGRAMGKLRTSVERSLLTLTVVGFLGVGLVTPDQAAVAVVFYPGTIVLAVLALDALGRGGARVSRNHGVIWFVTWTVLALVGVDVLSELVRCLALPIPAPLADPLAWVGVGAAETPASLSHRLLVAASGGAIAAASVSQASRRRRLPGRPALARVLLGLHLASQLALVATALWAPRGSLLAGQADLQAALLPDAVVEGRFAHALVLGGSVRAVLSPPGGIDPAASRGRGVSHLLVQAERFAREVRPRARRSGIQLEPVASLYVCGRRLRLVRIPRSKLARSAFEEGRRLLERGDATGACRTLRRLAGRHGDAPLPKALLALARGLAGEPGEAASEACAALLAGPSSVPALVVKAWLEAQAGRIEGTRSALQRVVALYPSPVVERCLAGLPPARPAGGAANRPVDPALEASLRVLVGDILR